MMMSYVCHDMVFRLFFDILFSWFDIPWWSDLTFVRFILESILAILCSNYSID